MNALLIAVPKGGAKETEDPIERNELGSILDTSLATVKESKRSGRALVKAAEVENIF